MCVRPLTFFLVFFFGAIVGGNCQQYQMTYYTVNEGLPSNTIRRIFQNSRGNIWLSTVEGLSKYDGHRFTNYTKANGLPHNQVNDMLETGDTIFFACNDGSLAWIQHDKIVKVTRPGAVINQFCKLKNGKVLAATDAQGIQEFNDGQLYKPPQAFPDSYYFSLAEINDSLLLAGSDSSVQILTKEYKLVKRFGGYSTYYGENKVYKDSRGRLWASHLPDPVQLSCEGIIYPPSLNIPELKGADIQQIFEDKTGNVWFAGIYGLVQLNPNGNVRILKKKNSLLSDGVICIFQDRENNLWIGTSLGLCKMSATTIVTSFGEADGLADPVISYMFNDKANRLIISTLKGWQFFNEKEGKFSPLINTNALPYAMQKQLAFHPLFHIDAGKPVLQITKAEMDIENFFRRQSQFGRGYIACRGSDDPGYIFISIGRNFYVYDGNKVIEDSSLGFSGKNNYTFTGMAIDKSGALWAGTWEEGLFKLEYSVENGQFRFTKKELVLPKIPIRSIMMDQEGNIWAGTRYHGVYRLKKKQDEQYEKENWNTETGLTSNWVHTVYEDEKHNIWLLYNDGLDKLVKKDNTFRPFNFSRVNNFFENIQRILSAGKGSFWLGTTNGLVRMQDGELEKKSPWPVNITAISVGDSLFHPAMLPATLPHWRNSLQINFSAPTYINEKQILYSYRLTGSGDTTWSSPGNIHSVSFASLRPGNYRFEVKTLGWNGQWGEATVLPFTIRPPLWQRGWFLIVSGLLIAGGITWLVRRRIKQIRQEAEMKQRLAETEMMALRVQMNPHFLFNSLNAIDSLIQTHQHDKATTYLGRFARLLRLVLDSSKNKLVPFDRDLAALQLYMEMERFRSAGKFRFEITAEAELLNGGYSIPPLLVQPFIENAIHHGLMNKQNDDRILTVQASLQDDFIIFNITDNGVGRAKAKELNALNKPEHVSYGWQITAQRLGLHNGGNGENYILVHDLYQDDEPCGTAVILKIKVNAN